MNEILLGGTILLIDKIHTSINYNNNGEHCFYHNKRASKPHNQIAALHHIDYI